MSIHNLVSVAGIFVMLGLAWAMSANRRRMNWRVIAWGVALQMVFAVFVFRLDMALPVQSIHVGGANVQAVANLALGLADLLVDGDVGFGVKLKDIQAQLGFNIHAFLPRSSAVPTDPSAHPLARDSGVPCAGCLRTAFL